MVTKHGGIKQDETKSLILAKIHMVTKPNFVTYPIPHSLILAKIHMVTKLKGLLERK